MNSSSGVFRVGTRSSNLALLQTRSVVAQLAGLLPECRWEIVPVSSPGDRDQMMDLRQSPPDFFTRDLDERVRKGEIDFAVHSAKDVPDPVPEGLDWCWLPWYEDPRDVLIRPRGKDLASLPADGRIGVSSERREAYCRSRFPAARQLPIRGTIEDRLRQLDQGDFELIIMAGAALNRLGMEDRITEWIPAEALPAPEGQGALALTFRAGDPRMLVLRRLFVKAVTFAGAGVGSAGHCTLESLAALQRCDVVLHDTLLGHELFDRLPPSVKCIDVGKRCGQHSVPQDETTSLIALYARRGVRVVRLKGGDPGIFGRLAEEVEALDALALPYRVLPGVTSLSAATTTTGMLLTRRGVSRGFTVMTPRKEGGGVGSVDADERKTLPIVFFMALSVAGEVSRQLMAEGKPPRLPAAVVYGAGSDQSEVVVADLETIAARIKGVGGDKPGLLVVGEAARYLYRKGGAYGGRRILLTASDALQEKAAALVADFGGVPVCRPLIRMVTTPDALECVRQLKRYDWLVLTSPSAVRCFASVMTRVGADWRSVPSLLSCGGGTSRELSAMGLKADLEPESDFSAAGLLAAAKGRLTPGARILRLRSDKAGDGIATGLRGLGAHVDDCLLYRNEPIVHEIRPEFDAVFFASASAVEQFMVQWGAGALAGKLVVAIGQPTLASLRSAGVMADLVPPSATVESSLEALARYYVSKEIR